MRTAVILWGRFHAFNLAAELHRQNSLSCLITSYPAWFARKFGVPMSKCRGHGILELYNRMLHPLGSKILRSLPPPRHVTYSVFPPMAAKKIPTGTDIVISWPGTAHHAFKRAREIGAMCVLDRGSSHPEFCEKVVNEEYRKYDISGKAMYRTQHMDMSIYEEADAVLIPSTFVRRTFLDHGFPGEKLIQVPYGVSLEHFYPLEKPKDTFRVIYVGQMSLQKGVHHLLRAVSELRLPDLDLLLVGSKLPEIEPYFEQHRGKFHHHPAVPQNVLVHHYNQANCFALCSIQDGFGMVLLQAMACGLPLISTTHTGGEDIIEEGVDGFIIPPGSVEQIKDKILTLYHDRDRCSRMGAAAAEKAKNFTWTRYGNEIRQKLEDAYEAYRG